MQVESPADGGIPAALTQMGRQNAGACNFGTGNSIHFRAGNRVLARNLNSLPKEES